MVRMGRILALGLRETQCTRACSRLGKILQKTKKKKRKMAGRTVNLV